MAEGVAYPDLVKAWAETCGRAVDWLISSGVKVSESRAGQNLAGSIRRSLARAGLQKRCRHARARQLKERFEQLGGRYLNGIEGQRLIVENGRVGGVIGKQAGEEIELRARATILSTGGFSANKELVKQYIGPHADECKLRGSKQDTGDGLRMALAIGAKAVNSEIFLRSFDLAQSAGRRPLLALSAPGLFCRRRHSHRSRRRALCRRRARRRRGGQ